MNMVVHQGALGDWVLTFPILRGLRGRTLAVTGWDKAGLAARVVGGVQGVNIERGVFTGLHGDWGTVAVAQSDRALLAGVEVVISFVSDGDDRWADNIRKVCPRARCVFVDTRGARRCDGHVGQWLAGQVRGQGVRVDPVSIGIGGTVDGPVVVHPGSGGREKCWAVDRFEGLIERLRSDGRAVVAVLGEAERERWDVTVVSRWVRRYGARVLGPLDELADVLGGASIYVGNDSGPTHLAAQMGLRTVALFGPTDPKRWGPVGPAVRMLAPGSVQAMGWLDVDLVVGACSPEGFGRI